MRHLRSNRHVSLVKVIGLTVCLALLAGACQSVRTTGSSVKTPNQALIWQKYTGEINSPEIPTLFDYSYAGYQLGEQGIPEKFPKLNVFNVLDYGAIPNDTLSDQEAIQKTIDAAELNNGGIVLFPPGEFLVNVNPTEAIPIEITKSNIILKGRGWGVNGTTINMKDHMLQSYPDQPEWQVNYMFKFFSKQKDGTPSPIIKSANSGDFTIEVENASAFKKVKFIQLEMPPNVEAVTEALQDNPARPHWERIKETGVTYVENHEIVDVSGNIITLKDPVINTINANYHWVAKPFYPLENVGVEDIFFKANFEDKFIHHKDFLHDNAWSMVSLNRVANSWVRRCRFSSVTGGVSFANSCASSMLMLLFEGNSGHKLTNVTQSARILTGLINDQSCEGQFHGASMSHKTSGSVIWRVKNPKQGWDSHAEFPINNLVDLYEGAKMTNHGGFYKNEPHHLEGLTLWNYKRVGGTVENYNFWKMSGKHERDMYWGFSVVHPIVVGLHGSVTTFNKDHVGYLESLGDPVLPASLYEAQLKFRLKNIPDWIPKALRDWQSMQDKWIPNKS
ncbi:DUF4955 domain-containing protein [Gelidibacter maritimus]|uniref:DUF4955 domain-containing protein n=1 Tax=Gelidibacter maritimus TaxID=2761487 RepID=A0A7W2M787_9FLAO|nr:DUF4955 domain-containing protein [Gelidibacter maritimus]MBA6154042.1 DUF4955 domain-containing protein [Gelidibacter maritimus]